MRKAVLVILLRLSLVIALGASAALFVEYQRAGDPAFCGVGSGCLAVRMSPYSKFFGISLPAIGLVAFSGLFLFALFARTKAHRQLLAALTGIGGVVAGYLIYLQATEIGAFCKWCVMVDSSAIVAAVVAGILFADTADATAPAPTEPALPLPTLAWLFAGVAALGLPFIWAQYPVVPALPPEIQALQVPGKVTIVSFTDFECPFCRGLHPTIDEILHEHGDRVVVIRKMMPLSGHPGAMPAALAYECAPEDKRSKMVDELYKADEQLLNEQGLASIAEARLGMDRQELLRCMRDPATRALVDKDMELFSKVQGAALPLTYIGPRVILGFNADRVRDAVALALAPARPSLPVWSMLALLGALFAGAAWITARDAARAGGNSR